MIYFFEEIHPVQKVPLILAEKALQEEEINELMSEARSTVHYKVIDMVLEELLEEQQIEFLSMLESDNHHPGVIEKLKNWIQDFENKVRSKVSESEDEIITILIQE
jgi:hypothetical protein